MVVASSRPARSSMRSGQHEGSQTIKFRNMIITCLILASRLSCVTDRIVCCSLLNCGICVQPTAKFSTELCAVVLWVMTPSQERCPLDPGNTSNGKHLSWLCLVIGVDAPRRTVSPHSFFMSDKLSDQHVRQNVQTRDRLHSNVSDAVAIFKA